MRVNLTNGRSLLLEDMTTGTDSPTPSREGFKEYYRTKARWERVMVGMCRPLGQALMERRNRSRPIRLREPKLKALIDDLIPRIKGWHAGYSHWRAQQGGPLEGRYRNLPPQKRAKQRLIAAAKELAYRLSLKEREAAREALKGLVAAAEEEFRQHQPMKRARRAESEGQRAPQTQGEV